MKKSRKVILISSVIFIIIVVLVILYSNKILIFTPMTLDNQMSQDEIDLIDGEHIDSKNKIINIVKENSELLNQVPKQINNISNSSLYLNAEKKIAIDYLSIARAYKDKEVKCTLGNIDKNKYIYQIIQNDVLYNVLQTDDIIISIRRFYSQSGRLCIIFDCTTLLFYFDGFYYTEDNRPIGWDGEDVDFKENGNQWVYEDDQGKYITERIIDHWFYYEEPQGYN